ncbi:MAG: Holliday junction resolvase RuvX [Luteolibacter sp.]|nr:Holliday junction resolvase RuvX [Luteolibacter sp.]
MHDPQRVIEVRFQRGLYLPEPDLWLDPSDPKPCAFVSHAHADHFARHESVICSETTGLLLHQRFRLATNRLDATSFHVPLVRNGFRLRLLPAGHIPGSAMLHVTRISDNATLLYTGDFKTRRSRTAETANFLSADTLVLETTFGLPGYEFPNPMEIEAEILRFVHDSFSDGATPILLAYSLGKAQEALALLEEHGIPALLHPAAAEMTRACREAGVPGLPEPAEFNGHAPPGHVVIAPPHAMRTKLLRGLKTKRSAMLSGWALQAGAKYRYRVDAMIPLSDHADHPGLMECIQRVHPRRILTVHGFTREFAAELRASGMDAWCAAGGDQLEFSIHRPAHRQPAARGSSHQRIACPLADFSDLCRLVAETGSRVAKTEFLKSYLGGLENDKDLRIAVRWLAGDFPPQSTGKRQPPMDASTLRHALAAIPGARAERYRNIHLASGDRTRSARLFLQELHLQPAPLDLTETAAFIGEFHHSAASMERVHRLAKRLATLHPADSETLLKLLNGDLRLGIDPLLLLEALAAACHAQPDELQRAMSCGADPGEIAVLARHRRLADAQATACSPSPRDPLRKSMVPSLKSHPDTPHPALGIDHGDARIGIAATDDFGILAHPVETIDRSRMDPIERIARLADIRKIRTLVVGLPFRMDGSEGESAAKVRAFADQLRQRIPEIPLVFVDESLSTSSAAAKLREAGRSSRHQKAVIDQAAAIEILNTWMGS